MYKQLLVVTTLTILIAIAIFFSLVQIRTLPDPAPKSMPAGIRSVVLTQTPTPSIKPSQNLVTPKPYIRTFVFPTCTTLAGKMIENGGLGVIGCDVKVEGDFILSKSYCEGQITKRRETLIPDGYRKQNQYYATLTNLNPNEEVKVFVAAHTGQMVECLPSLNK